MDLPKIPTTPEPDRPGIDLGSHSLGSAVLEGSGAPIDSYEGTAAANIPSIPAQSVAVRLQVTAGRGENFFSAASMQQRLNDALRETGFPEDILTVSQQEDGAIVIQAQSHKPQEATWQSWSKSFDFLKDTASEASRAREVLLEGDEQKFDQIVAAWGARFTDLASLKITIRGLENLDPNKTYLFAPTHMSLTEYGILFMALHGMPIGFMAKDEFRSNPLTFKLFGQAMAESKRFVFIQREDRNAAKAAADAATNLLSQKNNPYSLVVYPQGTRGSARIDANGRRMDADLFAKGPLKDGLGFMSLGTLQAGKPVEIVPIVINGLGQVWPKSPIEIAALQGNGGVEIIVGKPISPSEYHPSNDFSSDSIKGAARAMVAAIENFYRAHYKAPLSTREEVAARQAKSKKATAKAAQTPAQALEAGATLTTTSSKFASLLQSGKSILEFGAEILGFNKYQTDEDTKRLDKPLSDASNFPDHQLTWEKMRLQRFGFWLVGNLGRRVMSPILHPIDTIAGLLTPSRPNPTQNHVFKEPLPTSQIEDISDNFDFVYGNQIAQVEAFIKGQVALQTEAFQNVWAAFAQTVSAEYADMQATFKNFMRELQADPTPDFKIVSDARGSLHTALQSNPALNSVDANYRVAAFHILEAKEKFELAKSEGDPTTLARAQARYYRMYGQYLSYRVLDKIAANLDTDPRIAGWASVPKYLVYAPRNIDLRRRSERIKLISEALATNSNLRELAVAAQKEYDQFVSKVGLKRFVPLTYTKVKAEKLSERASALQDLLAQYGDKPLDEILQDLVGSEFVLFQSNSELTRQSVVEGDEATKSVYDTWVKANLQWENDQVNYINRRAIPNDVYLTQQFQFTLGLARQDYSLQVDRYADLMSQVRETGKVTAVMEKRYATALQAYQAAFTSYDNAAQAIASRAREGREPTRKKQEVALFQAWLALHWVVADVFKKVQHIHAGKIMPFSSIFSNQSEVLNNPASDEQQSLKPFFESMDSRVSTGMYLETILAGRDPRRIAMIIDDFGNGALNRGVSGVDIIGARTLVGHLGQRTGAQMMAEGAKNLLGDSFFRTDHPGSVIFDFPHVGYADLVMAGRLHGLEVEGMALGNPAQVHEATNFEQFPVMGPAFRFGNSIGFERECGSGDLQAGLAKAVGVSTIVFGSGTMRAATEAIPFSTNWFSVFAPKPYIMGGNVAEAGVAASRAGVPFVPGYLSHPGAMQPDVGLSGGIGAKNFGAPYGIGSGIATGGQAVIAFGMPLSGNALPKPKAEELSQRFGLNDIVEGQEGATVRRLTAAMTEVQKMQAYLAWQNSVAIDLRELASSTPDGASTEVTYQGKNYRAVGIPIGARSTRSTQTTQRAASPVGRR